MAHSAVLSEDLLGSNPTGIALHRVPTHACACSETFASGPRPKAQVRLAAAMCLHIAVALELVAGQTWAALQLGPRLWDPLPWRHGPRYTCQGHGLSGQSVVPPRLSGKSSCFGPSRLGYPSLDQHLPSPTERKARGLDLVARDKPSDNLMLKRCASRLPFTPRGPGPGGKGRPDPSRVRAQAV